MWAGAQNNSGACSACVSLLFSSINYTEQKLFHWNAGLLIWPFIVCEIALPSRSDPNWKDLTLNLNAILHTSNFIFCGFGRTSLHWRCAFLTSCTVQNGRMLRHHDTFQWQVGIQSRVKCLRLNSADRSNERWIKECFNLISHMLAQRSASYDASSGCTSAARESMVLPLISFIFPLSVFFLSFCQPVAFIREQRDEKPLSQRDSGWLNEILSLSLPPGSHGHKPGAISLLRCQYDRLPHPECRKSSGGHHPGEVVSREANSPKTWLWPPGRDHDGMLLCSTSCHQPIGNKKPLTIEVYCRDRFSVRIFITTAMCDMVRFKYSHWILLTAEVLHWFSFLRLNILIPQTMVSFLRLQSISLQ